jgi:glycine C-acetyltransferase
MYIRRQKVINLAFEQLSRADHAPKLREGRARSHSQYGVGSGAVRTIAGTMKIHMELEEKSRASRTSACVVFQSGFAANAGDGFSARQRRLYHL